MVIAADTWVVVGSIAGVAGIAVAVALFWLQGRRQRRSFGYEVSARALVRVGPEVTEKVQIQYEGHVVTDVHLVQVVLRNTGKVPIRPEDFDGPIVVSLPADAGLLPSTLSATGDPKELRPSASLEAHDVKIEPTLLNPGDRVTLGVLATGYSQSSGRVEVNVRVAGVRDIVETIDRPSDMVAATISGTGLTRALAAMVVAVVGLLVAVAGSFESFTHNTNTRVVLASGERLCGEVLAKDTAQLVMAQEDGRVRHVRFNDVRQVQNDAC